MKPWSSRIFAFRLAIARCSSGVGMWRKKLTSSGGLNDGSMCPTADGNVWCECDSTRPGIAVAQAQSTDNLAEVRRGWITRAASPAGLAGRLGLDPAVLTATLTEFNAAAGAGRDDRFGRRAQYMAPLDLTDLYAIELWPAVATTSGGPRRDARSRVVRPDGTPVPGLYAAGGAGTVWGPFTHSGGGLTDALVFGRLAGQNAIRFRR